jgi:hypothetical protein
MDVAQPCKNLRREMADQAFQHTCAMCGKLIAEQKNQIIVEVNGISYVFDSKDCELFFKKFKSVYGSAFNSL